MGPENLILATKMTEKRINYVGGQSSEIWLHVIVAHAHTNGFITGVWILLGHQKVDGFAVTVQRNKKND